MSRSATRIANRRKLGAAKVSAKAYTDVRELVAQEELDVCDVVVPAPLHHVVSCYLSECGISHNVETGLAPTLGLMDMMIQASAQNGVKLQTSENFPFVPVEAVCLPSDQVGRNWPRSQMLPTLLDNRISRFSRDSLPDGCQARRCQRRLVTRCRSYPTLIGARRNFDREGLEFYAVDFDNGGIGIAMVGNKNGCLGRNTLVGFETCGERGTVVTNGNQGATGGETVNVCSDEDIAERNGKARTYPFQREFAASGVLERIYVELPMALGGTIEWVNPYQSLGIEERNISLATMLDGIARAVREDTDPLWTGEMGRADQEMVIAAHRSIQSNRQPIQLPLLSDPAEGRSLRPRTSSDNLVSIRVRIWKRY